MDRVWLDGWRGGMSGRTDVGRCSSPAQESPISRTLPEQRWEVWKYRLASWMPPADNPWTGIASHCTRRARGQGVPAVVADDTPSDGKGSMLGLQLAWAE